MKFDYINKLPVELAVNAYIDQKVWKSGDKDIAEQKQFSIKEYLVQKMSVFVEAYSVEQQEAVRHFFLKKIEGIKVENIQPKVYSQTDCEDLENRIGEKIKNCFSDLIHEETSFKEENGKKWRVEAWGDSERQQVNARWGLKLTPGGAPSVNIEWFIASNQERSKGRATLFLKKIVEELQKEKTPHARIELNAWTGYNSGYGRTNGAYTWGRLGFQVKESTKKERLADCDDSKHIDYMKENIQEYLKNDRCDVYNYLLFTKLKKRPRLESEEVDYIIAQTIEKLKSLETPWDIANLTVEGYPIGKHLMSSLDKARFNGVLYPNVVHSPGMIQYTKRMEELRKAGHLP